MLNYLKQRGMSVVLLVNDDGQGKRVLESNGIDYVTANYDDTESNWEARLIKDYEVDTWINDRWRTSSAHARNVKASDIRLITFDDEGDGAEFSDANIVTFALEDDLRFRGKTVLKGPDYMILHPDIDRYKRSRGSLDKVVVTLGGSDTYGVTVDVVGMLRELNCPATVHVGPGFQHYTQLEQLLDANYPVISDVPSLISVFDEYDLAITGGGVTPFEANAMGLPCFVISSEEHERRYCTHLDSLGSSSYLGHRGCITSVSLGKTMAEADIAEMSKRGMEKVSTKGMDNVWKAIEAIDHE